MAATVATLCTASAAGAQITPNADWRTLRTAHFRVHFTPPLEEQARRLAFDAERAFGELSSELVPPRTPVDVVLSDDVDYANGSATPVPSNRIVVYAHPPIDDLSLRSYDDWNSLVITHELTHIFHLDRTRGLWRAAQRVFGRNLYLFPNEYAPAWLTEGLAVYYESRLTGSGRLAGSEHAMLARAAAQAGHVPRLDELSLSAPRFPAGEGAYAYGSLLIEYLARTRGARTVRAFVERSSRTPIPFLLDRTARRSFGVTFQAAWREWRDSLRAVAGSRDVPMPGWRELTTAGWYAGAPRWVGDSTLTYAANTGRETAGVYTVGLGGRSHRLGRRNDLGPNVPLPGGALLYAQTEFVNPYRARSDLYVQSGRAEHRLTRHARLARPDARADGAIVAMQATPGSTRLVRVSADGRVVTPLTAGTLDEQWTEPRWSPAGDAIAAVRWRRGGRSAVVVLDTLGAVRRVIAEARAVVSGPSWSADGSTIFFSSDVTGRTEVYVADAGAASPAPAAISRTPTGLFSPAPSPDGARLAALELRADGYHVGVAPLTVGRDSVRGSASEPIGGRPYPPAQRDSSPSRGYSPWRTLLPRYWTPVGGTANTGNFAAGAQTSGADVVGRHSYAAQSLVDTRTRELDASAVYTYRGLGQPTLEAVVQQSWDHFTVYDAAVSVGDLRRRTRMTSLAARFSRPRVRTNAWLSGGAEMEWRNYDTDPDTLLADLASVFRSAQQLPSLFVAVGWGNTQRPFLAISPEDGVLLSTTVRQRWRSGSRTSPSRSVIGVASGFKSLDLRGYAHHVVAVRAAAGFADSRAASEFSVGGTSGEALELFPGYRVGGEPRTFGVRGFAAGTAHGLRAVSSSAEYRLPLWNTARGVGLLPVFLSRSSATAFADGGTAWCGLPGAGTEGCGLADARRNWIASGGAELVLESALQYDVPYRFRIGVAVPLRGRQRTGARPASVYFTLGASF